MNSNPIFTKLAKQQEQETIRIQASYKGVVMKTILMFAILVVSAITSLLLAIKVPTLYLVLLIASLIMGFVSVMVASTSPRLSRPFSIIYAVSEGFLVGVISVMFAAAFEGLNIIGLAVIITLGIFAGMLVLYMTNLIQVTSRMRKVLYGISFGILFSLLFVGLVSIFDGGSTWYTLFGNPYSPLVLLLTLLFIFYGAFMLVISFDDAKRIVEGGADKNYEWMVGLGLVVSTIYIYFQVLRLLAIILSRRK